MSSPSEGMTSASGVAVESVGAPVVGHPGMRPMRGDEAKALSARVATEVMGWSAWCSPCVPRGVATPDCWRTGNRHSPTYRISGFDPSTNMGLVSDFVIPRLIELGALRVDVIYHPSGRGECSIVGPRTDVYMRGSSPAHAVCLAALAFAHGDQR